MATHQIHTDWQHACQSQQRQILAMIGVDTWVQRHTQTKPILDIHNLDDMYFRLPKANLFSKKNQQKSYTEVDINQTLLQKNQQSLNKNTQNSYLQNNVDNDCFFQNDFSNIKDIHDDNIIQPDPKDINTNRNTKPVDNQTSTPAEQPMAFQLQGLCIYDKILLIDVAKLDKNCQLLWQNLAYSLSATVEQLIFPFCQEMSSQEMANASLAGFLFKLSKGKYNSIVVLTDLPNGLNINQDKIQYMPNLREMLANSQQKRLFWQLLLV